MENKQNNDFKLYTLKELAPILDTTQRALLTYIKENKLKAVMIGGKWRVSEKNLNDFINGD